MGLQELKITVKMKHKEVSRLNEIHYIEKRKDYAVNFNRKFLGYFRN
jgi:hypothetical protein